MAMSRRGLKEHDLRSHSPLLPRSRISTLRKRRDLIDNCENEFSVSEDEGTDEPDRCLSHHHNNVERDGKMLSSSLTDLSTKDKYHHFLQTDCKPKRPMNSKFATNHSSPSKLYPNLSEVESEERVRRRHNGLTPSVLIGIVILIIVCMLAFGYSYEKFWPSSHHLQKNTENILGDMKRDLKTLKQMTEQTKHFWIQILSQMESLTETYPLQPAIILAIVPLESKKTAACLSPRILEIVSAAFEDQKHISFDVHSHKGRNSTVLKHDLDEFFQGLSESHAAGVYNLEKLVPEAAMIFHAYCDNENAPHKKAFLFFTLEIDLSYPSLALDRLDYIVYQYLMELWSGSLREDDSAAIVSRIANAPVVYRPESPETIETLCSY